MLMNSFKTFVESDGTRVEYEPTTPQMRSPIKDKNITTAQKYLKENPQITLKELIGGDTSYLPDLEDMITFAKRHDFDESMPLRSLLLVYTHYAR